MTRKARPLADRLAENLAALIAQRHESPTAAARRLGIPQPTMSRLLARQMPKPGVEVVAQIAAGYGVSIETLIGEPERPTLQLDHLGPAIADVMAAAHRLEALVNQHHPEIPVRAPRRPLKPAADPTQGGREKRRGA
jgi:transcriptional regulator with XRE-family HTH domain